MNGDGFKLEIRSGSENESFARVCAGAFAARLDPTLDEISDIKAAISEAVTNAVVHGYSGKDGAIVVSGSIEGRRITFSIEDRGVGIDDVEQARRPFFTTCEGEDRSGMGFTMMEAFMDSVTVESKPGSGTKVTMTKLIGEGGDGAPHA